MSSAKNTQLLRRVAIFDDINQLPEQETESYLANSSQIFSAQKALEAEDENILRAARILSPIPVPIEPLEIKIPRFGDSAIREITRMNPLIDILIPGNVCTGMLMIDHETVLAI